MLKRVMVVVLLGCVGLTAGVAFGTLFSSNNISRPFTMARSWNGPTSAAKPFPSALMPFRSNCHGALRYQSTPVQLPKITVHHLHPGSLSGVAPSAPLPMGGYVLLGLLAGLSAALGFLVPPRSRLTRR